MAHQKIKNKKSLVCHRQTEMSSIVIWTVQSSCQSAWYTVSDSWFSDTETSVTQSSTGSRDDADGRVAEWTRVMSSMLFLQPFSNNLPISPTKALTEVHQCQLLWALSTTCPVIIIIINTTVIQPVSTFVLIRWQTVQSWRRLEPDTIIMVLRMTPTDKTKIKFAHLFHQLRRWQSAWGVLIIVHWLVIN